MPVSESDRARIVRLLLLDVEATIGPDYETVVLDNAMNVASFTDDPVRYRDKVLEDVQQHFHDSFVDVTWPTCPRHSNHPLWLRGDSWYCAQDDEAIAELGELRSIRHGGSAD